MSWSPWRASRPFARPRDLDILYTPDFNDMVHELRGNIAEARKAA